MKTHITFMTKTNHIYKLSCLILMMLLSGNIIAQSGPIVPCVNCEQFQARTEPMNGLWYNPEQAGSGYSIEVQDGLVYGIYYGYDSETKPTWLTFLGELAPSDEPDIMWTFDANLEQFEGGSCLNCNYNFPHQTDFESTIHIDFKHKNYASMSVNDGAVQNVVPLVYNFPSSADFPEQTSYQLPDLYGMWSFVFRINSDIYPDYWNQWGYYSIMLHIRHKSPPLDLDNDGNDEIRYYTRSYSSPAESLPFGTIECEANDQDGEIIGPSCFYRYDQGLFGQLGEVNIFHMPLSGIGATRIFGETEDGHTFEAIKVDSTEYPNTR